MTRWLFLTLLMLFVRAFFALLWLASGELVGFVMFCAEGLSLVLAAMNLRERPCEDEGGRAYAFVACYLASVLLVPAGGGAAWAGPASLFVLACIFWARWTLWSSYTVGPSSWVRLVDREHLPSHCANHRPHDPDNGADTLSHVTHDHPEPQRSPEECSYVHATAPLTPTSANNSRPTCERTAFADACTSPQHAATNSGTDRPAFAA